MLICLVRRDAKEKVVKKDFLVTSILFYIIISSDSSLILPSFHP